jgi:hypothetical protein
VEPKPDRPQMPDVYGIGRDGSAAGEKLRWTEAEFPSTATRWSF